MSVSPEACEVDMHRYIEGSHVESTCIYTGEVPETTGFPTPYAKNWMKIMKSMRSVPELPSNQEALTRM